MPVARHLLARGLLAATLAVSPGAVRAQDAQAPPEATPAGAEEAPVTAPVGQPVPAYDAPDETIYVEDQAVIRARAEVGLALRELGYDRKRVRNGREVYTNADPWKPQVLVDDDGWMLVRRAPPSFGKPDMPGIWGGPLGYLVCVAAPTSCIHIGGWVVSKHKLGWAEHEVVEQSRASMDNYQQALLARNLRRRTGEELPSLLEALWEHGESPASDTLLETPEARRAALLDLWATRTCTDWGDEAREVVRLFMQYEVQESATPFTREEIGAANARRSCLQELVIEGL
ncbi:MAG: hypothetical protein ABIO70_31610 [Pseudomonadota bacterium]